MNRLKLRTFHLSLACIIAGSFLLNFCSSKESSSSIVRVLEHDSIVEVNNGIVKCEVSQGSSHLIQTFYAKRETQWELIAKSLYRTEGLAEEKELPLYASGPEYANDLRLFANEGLSSFRLKSATKSEAQILLSGKLGEHKIEVMVSLKSGEDFFHVEVEGNLSGTPPKIEYLLSSYVFSPAGAPDYSHVPALKRSEEDIVGDRKFYAPAAIVQKGRSMMALVPDLNLINRHVVNAEGARPSKAPKLLAVDTDPSMVSMPLAMDLNVSPGMQEHAIMSFGFMDYILLQHVYFQHENRHGAMVRTLSDNTLKYGFDLFLKADVPEFSGYRRISSYLWEKYGSRYFKLPRPQAMPLTEYARICYPAAIHYQGYVVRYDRPVKMSIEHRKGHPEMATWQQWEMGAKPVGGFRSNDNLNNREHLLYFGFHLNNVDDACGMYYWGKKLSDPSLVDKAQRVINLALSAPQSEGLFPGAFDVDKHSWVSGEYNTEAASATAGFLLHYHTFCESRPDLLSYVRNYGEFLVRNVSPEGCLPGYLNESLEPLPKLKWNASGGVHIWVLSELYKQTGDEKFLETAVRMAGFMIREILPHQRWHDTEAFYGCGNKPEAFFDTITGQYPANTQSVYWAMMGFASLYENCPEPQYREAAEAVADYSIFYQAVWNPHFIITAYPFGGFGVQNTDAEWLDQRNHRFAVALLQVGLLSGRQDLMERAVAAAHASFVLVNHPCHQQNDIYNHPNFPPGLGPENIDHDGYPQMPLRSGPNWGETGALSAAAYFLEKIGGVYINFEKKLAVGVDGLSVENYEMEGQCIRITLRSMLTELALPYQDSYGVDLKIAGLSGNNFSLVINDDSAFQTDTKKLASLGLRIDSHGQIRLNLRGETDFSGDKY